MKIDIGPFYPLAEVRFFTDFREIFSCCSRRCRLSLFRLAFAAAGYDPADSLFDVVSAAGTVGLSTGAAGHDLPVFLKFPFCADMMPGRLEVLSFLVVCGPGGGNGER